MKIGFIGTGHISKSVINGILGSKLKINKIIVSKRNSKISSELKRKSKIQNFTIHLIKWTLHSLAFQINVPP